MKTKADWIDNCDSYTCPDCGFECDNPLRHSKIAQCPKCGFVPEKYKGRALDRLLKQLESARNNAIKLNNIKYPEYDHYINGWDDCISFIENVAEMVKHQKGQE